MQVMQNLVEDEYHLPLSCLTYNAILKKYVDVLDGHNNLDHVFDPQQTSKYHHHLFYKRAMHIWSPFVLHINPSAILDCGSSCK